MGDEASDAAALDRAFAALSDPIRRAMIARLSRGPATATELGDPLPISKQAVSKHIAVLELAGLVTRSQDAQRRPVHLQPAALERLTGWLDRFRLLAEQRYRRLDDLLTSQGWADPPLAARSDPPRSTTAPEEET